MCLMYMQYYWIVRVYQYMCVRTVGWKNIIVKLFIKCYVALSGEGCEVDRSFPYEMMPVHYL